MDKRSCLILQRAREAASLVLYLRRTHTKEFLFLLSSIFSIYIPFYKSTGTSSSFFVFFLFLFVIFHSSPEEVVLHISNFLYNLIHALSFPWEELSVLEVIEHDGNEAHLIIRLKHENKKAQLTGDFCFNKRTKKNEERR